MTRLPRLWPLFAPFALLAIILATACDLLPNVGVGPTSGAAVGVPVTPGLGNRPHAVARIMASKANGANSGDSRGSRVMRASRKVNLSIAPNHDVACTCPLR